jgi:hypothetical protein
MKFLKSLFGQGVFTFHAYTSFGVLVSVVQVV